MIQAEVMKAFEQAIDRIVEQPKDKVIQAIANLAAKNPEEPAFHLALAMLSGFGEDFVGSRDKVANHLGAARRLIDRKSADMEKDAHLQFALHLQEILEIEQMIAAHRDRRLIAEREMQRAVNRLKGDQKEFLETILNAVRALSLMSIGTSNRRGKQRLTEIFSKSKRIKNFAGFTLAYAHRQDLETDDALKVAQELEKGNPRSIVVKEILAGIASSKGVHEEAVRNYQEAERLAPKSIPIKIGLAIALGKAGQKDEALKAIREAIHNDTTGRYGVYTRNVLLSLSK
jgi:tetratricopeptide (TPR) repeat protein